MFQKIDQQAALPQDAPLIERVAVRGVIMHGDKLFLIQSRLGDVKFPGGGVKNGEHLEQALLREIAEETGYIDCSVGRLLGEITERSLDCYVAGAIFQMTSYYYYVTLQSTQQVAQQLDDYEAALDLQAVWLTMDEAIACNEALLGLPQQNAWMMRELFVLKELKNTDSSSSL